MADITDFEVGQGETFKILVQLLNRSENNTPIDITHHSFSGQVRQDYVTDEVAATFTIEKINPYSSGSIFIKLSPEDTATLGQRSYVYDVKFTSGSGDTIARRILEGGFTIRPAVTR
jgi:hypothetical protein